MSSQSLKYLKADMYRYTESYSYKKIIKNVLCNRNFRPVFTMRMCQHFNEKGTILSKILLTIFRVFHRSACNKACIDLSWKTCIGPGFRLTHGWGSVINENVVIGSNVTIFHGATIGTKHKILENGERIPGYPTIKDNVWIGANSVIVGDIIIGEGSTVAPLTMVYKSVNPHTIVGCNPQRILKENALEDVFNKAPIGNF